MNWTEKQIKNIVHDLSEENAFACRALFQISEIIFTRKVPTLAVTLSKNPMLLINMNFLNKYAITEYHVRAVLMHEFLHVVLLHTEKYSVNTPLINIALDAIINSIIHRRYGDRYSDFFSKFYKWEGLQCLLRPKLEGEHYPEEWDEVHKLIYSGKLAGDDLLELLRYLNAKSNKFSRNLPIFIGNHGRVGSDVSPENKKLLTKVLEGMNGTGIWNNPAFRGVGEDLQHEQRRILKNVQQKWKRRAFDILKKCMTVDDKKKELAPSTIILPMLSESDRRSKSLISWSTIIPLSENEIIKTSNSETTNIYLDVSGSMNEELELLTPLLFSLIKCIKLPLWTFSDQVTEAKFQEGKLVVETTMGTSISCVFDHIRKTKSKKNVIITDGYTENISQEMLKDINLNNLYCLVSSEGSPSMFDSSRIKYYQFDKLK